MTNDKLYQSLPSNSISCVSTVFVFVVPSSTTIFVAAAAKNIDWQINTN